MFAHLLRLQDTAWVSWKSGNLAHMPSLQEMFRNGGWKVGCEKTKNSHITGLGFY